MSECSCGSFADSQITAYNPWSIYWHLLRCGKLASPLILILTASPVGTAHPLWCSSETLCALSCLWSFTSLLPHTLCQTWWGLVWLDLSQPSLIRLGSSILTAVPQKCVAVEGGSTSKPSHRVFTYLLWFWWKIHSFDFADHFFCHILIWIYDSRLVVSINWASN